MSYEHLLKEKSWSLDLPSPNLISTDSRNLHLREWFVCLKGENFDGHHFIKEALARGAQGIILSDLEALKGQKTPYLLVEDGMRFMYAIANFWHQELASRFPPKTVIGITGSNGKTTTKELALRLLSPKWGGIATKDNQNNELGVALTLCRWNIADRFCILEMGARKTHDIKILCDIAKPKIRVCLNIGSAHLEIFGSKKNQIETKLEILASADPSDILIYNADDEHMVNLAQAMSQKAYAFSRSSKKNAEVFLIDEKPLQDGSLEALFSIDGSQVKMNFPVYQTSLLDNVMAAAAIGLAMGLNAKTIAENLSGFAGAKGRFEKFNLPSGLSLIHDAYNSNLESCFAGLISLERTHKIERAILVLGDMRELGPNSEPMHRELGERCARLNPAYLITVGDYTLFTKEEALRKGFPVIRHSHFDKVEDLIAANFPFARKGELIYLKGSRAMALEKLIPYLKNS